MTKQAAEIVERVHTPLANAMAEATGKLVDGGVEVSAAVAKVSALLIAELSKVIANAADQGRASNSRTFEAMFDIDGASSHFQTALEQGIAHAAAEIKADGFTIESAKTLAASRALDAVAEIVKR